jgi:dienelactone hydrolase
MENTRGQGVKSAILQAQLAPHGLPGKVAVVGFSLGGGEALFWSIGWDDLIAGEVLWYPAQTFIHNIPGWTARIKTPVLMFAGEDDTFRGCCLVGHAHELADAASAAGAPFTLVTYPGTDHDFVIDGAHYNQRSYDDAFAKTAAKLKEYFGE